MNLKIIFFSTLLLLITIISGLEWMLDYGFGYIFTSISFGWIAVLIFNKKFKFVFNFKSAIFFIIILSLPYFLLVNLLNFSMITWGISYLLLIISHIAVIKRDEILNFNEVIFKSMNIFLFLYIIGKFLKPDSADSFYLGTGYVAISFIPFSIYTFFQSKGRISKIISAITISLSMVYLLNYGLRGASISILSGLISLLILYKKEIRTKLCDIRILYPTIFTILISYLSLILFYSAPNPNNIGDDQALSFQKGNSRGFLYIEAINQISQKPLLGYGINANFDDIAIDSVSYGIINQREHYTAHSDIIHLTYKLGFLGLFLHIYLYSIVLAKLIKNFNNPYSKAGIFAISSGLIFGMTQTFLVAPLSLRSTTICLIYTIFSAMLYKDLNLIKDK